MPHLFGLLYTSPVAGMVFFLCGLSLALCGYLGHTRPVQAGLKSFLVFLGILLFLCFLWFGIATGEASDFVAAFLAPFTAVIGFVAPVAVLWLDLRRANQQMKPTRFIPKWLRPPVFTIGIIIVFMSIPGLLRFLIEFT